MQRTLKIRSLCVTCQISWMSSFFIFTIFSCTLCLVPLSLNNIVLARKSLCKRSAKITNERIEPVCKLWNEAEDIRFHYYFIVSLHWKSYLELIEDSLICMTNTWDEQGEGREKLVRRKFTGQLCHNLLR